MIFSLTIVIFRYRSLGIKENKIAVVSLHKYDKITKEIVCDKYQKMLYLQHLRGRLSYP